MRQALPILSLVIGALVVPAGCRHESAPAKEMAMITVYQSSVELGDPHICSDSAM